MKVVMALLIWALLAGLPAFAAVEVHEFDDPAQEARYKKLIAELRCLVCQNQNLADSNAELALDLRNKTYEMVRAGKSDEEIISYMVQRYGDFVLYRPPLKTTTVLLWLGPFLIMGVGVAVLLNVIRRRRRVAAAETIEEDRLARARELLEQEDTSA